MTIQLLNEDRQPVDASPTQIASVRIGLGVLSGEQVQQAIAIAVAALRAELAGSPSPAPAPGVSLTPGLTTMGDSLTEAPTISTANRWANRLAASLGLMLTNRGISGTVLQNSPDASGSPRANNMRDRFVAQVLGSNLRSHLAMLPGLNDARYTGSPSTMNVANFQNDLAEMVDLALAAGVLPGNVYLGFPWIPDAGFSSGSAGFTGSNRTILEAHVAAVYYVAYTRGTKYARVYETMTTGDVGPDDIHPPDAGQITIGNCFSAATVPVVSTWPGRTGGSPAPAPGPSPSPSPPPAPATAVAVTFSARSAELVDISSGVYGSSSGQASFNGIGLVAGMLGAGVEGWIQAQYSDNSTAGAVLTLDADGGLASFDTNTFLGQFVPNGTVLHGQNTASSTPTGHIFLAPSASSHMRLARSAAGVVTVDTTTNDGETWTPRHTFPGTYTGALYARVYTSQLRRLNQVRTHNLA